MIGSKSKKASGYLSRKMKRLLILAIILLLPTLSGCWDYEEYEDMAIVTTIGFDSGPGKDEITMTVATYTPSGGSGAQAGGIGGGGGSGSGAEPSPGEEVYSAHAASIVEAIDLLNENTDKEIFFGYTRVIVLGGNITEKALKNVLFYLDISLLHRNTIDVVVTDGMAREVLNIYDMENASMAGQRIKGLLNVTSRTGTAYEVQLNKFIQALFSDGVEPALPLVFVKKLPGQTGTDNAGNAGQTGMKTSGKLRPEHAYLQMSGMAALKGVQITGFLSTEESRGLGWILSKRYYNHVAVPCRVSGRTGTFLASFRMKNAKTKIKIELETDGPAIYLETKVVATLESFDAEGVRMDAEQMRNFQTGLADAIKGDIEAAVIKAQALNTDIFGFGRQLHIQHKKAWREEYQTNWYQYFASLPVHVRVTAKVLQTGKVVETLES